MRKPLLAMLVVAVALLGVAAPAASAKEKVLTLYSPKIQSLPYVHDTHQVALRADGIQAPAEPGYITGWKEMALVDSKDPDAKPLPIGKMMVHHFLYYAPAPRTRARGAAGARPASSAGAVRSTRSGAPPWSCPPPTAGSSGSRIGPRPVRRPTGA